MARHLLTRLGYAVLVLVAAYTVSFVVLDLLPGDPATIMAEGGQEQNQVDERQLAQLRHQYGLDQPVPVRYVRHLGAALHGDLGRSVQTGQPVTGMLGQALPQTLLLAGSALALAALLGGTLALASTYTRSRWLGQLLGAAPTLGVSLPTFWVGLMLVQVVSFRWRLLPAFGNDGVRGLVLPALTLALPTAAVIAQVLARSLRATLGEPYVETARAKGAGRARVHLRHALRNACLPALTVVGVLLGNLLAGSVVVETVFGRAGVGRITVTAVGYQDIPVVQGVVLLGATVFVLANLAVDLVYPLLDPRIATPTRKPVTS
jgi:peptide/nickel transport system permease protein